MPLANLCAMAVGLLIAAIGVLGIASPSALLELGRALQSIGGVWLLGFVRIVCGAILLWAAPNARMPRVLIALGILIILFGLATPFIGIERSRAMFELWTSQGTSMARAWPVIAIALGAYISYVVTSPA
jgi:hypothetical protein